MVKIGNQREVKTSPELAYEEYEYHKFAFDNQENPVRIKQTVRRKSLLHTEADSGVDEQAPASSAPPTTPTLPSRTPPPPPTPTVAPAPKYTMSPPPQVDGPRQAPSTPRVSLGTEINQRSRAREDPHQPTQPSIFFEFVIQEIKLATTPGEGLTRTVGWVLVAAVSSFGPASFWAVLKPAGWATPMLIAAVCFVGALFCLVVVRYFKFRAHIARERARRGPDIELGHTDPSVATASTAAPAATVEKNAANSIGSPIVASEENSIVAPDPLDEPKDSPTDSRTSLVPIPASSTRRSLTTSSSSRYSYPPAMLSGGPLPFPSTGLSRYRPLESPRNRTPPFTGSLRYSVPSASNSTNSIVQASPSVGVPRISISPSSSAPGGQDGLRRWSNSCIRPTSLPPRQNTAGFLEVPQTPPSSPIQQDGASSRPRLENRPQTTLRRLSSQNQPPPQVDYSRRPSYFDF